MGVVSFQFNFKNQLMHMICKYVHVDKGEGGMVILFYLVSVNGYVGYLSNFIKFIYSYPMTYPNPCMRIMWRVVDVAEAVGNIFLYLGAHLYFAIIFDDCLPLTN